MGSSPILGDRNRSAAVELAGLHRSGPGTRGVYAPGEAWKECRRAQHAVPRQICWVPGNVGARHAVPEVPDRPPGF